MTREPGDAASTEPPGGLGRAGIEAWRVHDSGLVTVADRFRRLSGVVRHHQGEGAPWPDRVLLALVDSTLVVTTPSGGSVGRWPRADVDLRALSEGPPVTFTIRLPGAAHLLAAAADEATARFLAALT